jgi:hypothetical protein
MTATPRLFKVQRIQALLLDRDHAGAFVLKQLKSGLYLLVPLPEGAG